MRITEDRYSRDRLRMDVAIRFIENEARTHTIRSWTGLSDDRIRKLYKTYLEDSGRRAIVRHRGRSPHQAAHFTRTARLRHESAVFASVCLMAGLVRPQPGPVPRRPLPDVQRAALLCHAYEFYRALVEKPVIGFEHAVLLVAALGRSEELGYGHCHHCRALVVVDRLSLRAAQCGTCAPVAELVPARP
jgi:hypothetical protein